MVEFCYRQNIFLLAIFNVHINISMTEPLHSSKPHVIPEAVVLERNFKNNHRISMGVLWGVIILDVLLLLLIISSKNYWYYMMGVVAILISLISLKDDYIFFFKRKKELLQEVQDDVIGNYRIQELRELIASIFSQFKDKEIPRVYIIDEPIDGAHVIDTYVFNFIGPMNAIYLPRQAFYYLKPDELKAIISHELGHFYNYIYPAQRFPYPFYLLVSLIPAFLLPLLQTWIVVLIFLGLHFGFYPLLHKLFNYKSKTLEYLSDLFAAKRCGKLNTINGLMVSSKYSELIEVLHKKTLKLIKDDDELSINSFDDIFDKLVRILPDKPNSTDEAEKILTTAIEGFSFKPYKTNMKKSEISKEKAIITALLNAPELVKKRELLNWDTFDFVERNHRVEEGEYAALIDTIQNTHLYLVDSVNDDEDETLNETHPALRHRILFLHKNVKELNASILS